jgi:hypothetical protein
VLLKEKKMRREKALKLSKDWMNRVCSHPYKETEYYLGLETGFDVCVVCGKIFPKSSAMQQIKNRFIKEYKIKFRL